MKDQKKVKFDVTIDAPAKEIFSLVCPVMEYKWIDGWKCELIHLPNGFAENGTIFKEIMSAPFIIGNIGGKTTWSTLVHDSTNYTIHFKLDNKVSTTLYKIELTPINEKSTKYSVEFNYNPINERGRKFIKHGGEGKIEILIVGLATMIKHYSETGELYKSDKSTRIEILSKQFSKSGLIKILLNRTLMTLTWDANRRRFFKGKPISKSMV